MKVLVTGAAGLLGYHLCNFLTEAGYNVVGVHHFVVPKDVPWRSEYCDLLNENEVLSVLQRVKPDVVVNCVAATDVDKCEDFPSLAYQTNVVTVKYLARYSFLIGSRLIHISTDHLFDGKVYRVTEQTPPDPVNVYGRSKWSAERVCQAENPLALIVRTTFYGWAPPEHKSTYADWLYTSFKDQKPMKLFDDYFFNPLEVTQLSQILSLLLGTKLDGVINACGKETVSKALFGFEFARTFGFDSRNAEVTSITQGSTKAPRPTSLSMSVEKLISLGIMPGSIKEGLAHLYNTMKKEK